MKNYDIKRHPSVTVMTYSNKIMVYETYKNIVRILNIVPITHKPIIPFPGAPKN